MNCRSHIAQNVAVIDSEPRPHIAVVTDAQAAELRAHMVSGKTIQKNWSDNSWKVSDLKKMQKKTPPLSKKLTFFVRIHEK